MIKMLSAASALQGRGGSGVGVGVGVGDGDGDVMVMVMVLWLSSERTMPQRWCLIWMVFCGDLAWSVKQNFKLNNGA